MRNAIHHPLTRLSLGFCLLLGCSSDSDPVGDGGASGNDGNVSQGEGGLLDGSAGGADGSAAGDGGGAGNGDDGGSGNGNSEEGGANGPGCDDALMLTVRDFTEDHDDFENRNAWERGIVEDDLGADSKPVYAHSGSTSATEGPEEFAQWYRDVPGVNMRFDVEIRFEEDAQQPGHYVYDNSEFFPLDGMGFGNGPGDSDHNFLFTTEAHTRFKYMGGEEFTFRGDDDLWIFINGKLAIDLGGVHGVQEETIDLDDEAAQLGIEVGSSYSMDIFHAERHTSASNFRIETTIDLSCIENVTVI